MKKTVRPTLIVTAWCALFAACVQPPPPVRTLPPGPIPAEVIGYATAQVQYRAAKASGNGDGVTHAENTFWGISQVPSQCVLEFGCGAVSDHMRILD